MADPGVDGLGLNLRTVAGVLANQERLQDSVGDLDLVMTASIGGRPGELMSSPLGLQPQLRRR
jgi:hypothetical protein